MYLDCRGTPTVVSVIEDHGLISVLKKCAFQMKYFKKKN